MSLLLLLGAPPAEPEAGFTSAAWLGVGGVGSPAALLDLAPTSTVGITGEVTAAAPSLLTWVDFGFAAGGGFVVVNGTAGVTGDIQSGFNLAPSTLPIVGTIAATGDLDRFIDLNAAPLPIAGTVTAFGDINFLLTAGFRSPAWLSVGGIGSPVADLLNIVQTAAPALSGTLAISGDVQTWFNLATTPVAIAGTFATSGEIGIGFGLATSPITTISGELTVSGDIEAASVGAGFRSPAWLSLGGIGVVGYLDLVASAVAITGTATVTGQIEVGYNLSVVSFATISGTISASGQIGTTINFVPSTLALGGAAGVAGALQYAAAKNLTLAPLSVIGVVGVAGEIDRFINLIPALLPISGTVAIAGDTQYSISKDIGTAVAALTGVVSTSADLQSAYDWEFESSLFVDITGAMFVAGDVEGTGSITHDVVASPVALDGSLSAIAELAYSIRHDLVASPIAFTGVISQSGNFEASFQKNLTFEALPINGSLALVGDLQRDSNLVASPVVVAGLVTVGADLDVYVSVNLQVTASLDFVGGMSVSGNTESTTDVLLDVVPQPVGISGSLSAHTDAFGMILEGSLEILAYQIAIDGALSADGDVRIEFEHDLVCQPIELAGQLSAVGDIQEGINVQLTVLMSAMSGVMAAFADIGFSDIVPFSADRTIHVASESRTVYVAPEDRDVYVDPEYPDMLVES